MVKINISPALEKELKDLYGEESFRIANPAYPGKGKKIRKTKDVSLCGKLKDEISQYVGKTANKISTPILQKFLEHHFVDKGEVSERRIEIYLFRKDPDQIIRTFWNIVADRWTSALNKNPKQLAYYARKLCEMNSIQRFDLCEDDRPSYNNQTAIPLMKELDSFVRVYPVNKGTKWKVKFQFHDELYGKQTGALTILKKIFDYRKKMKDELRHKLMSKMSISACPYCNRQYITNYKTANGEKPLADLDHYYCKSRYPFLALSIYNFVPGCQICNSRFKKDIDFYIDPHVNPHKRGFSTDATFVLKDLNLLLDDSAWNDHSKLAIKLNVAGPDADIINRSIQTFHLNEVYESHTDYVREIIWKSKAYSPEMIKCVRDEFGMLFSSEDEIKELIFGQYLRETDAGKRPLAKLTQDLLGKADNWNWPVASQNSKD